VKNKNEMTKCNNLKIGQKLVTNNNMKEKQKQGENHVYANGGSSVHLEGSRVHKKHYIQNYRKME